MQRVLVTGAAGFIGRHCVEALGGRAAEIHAVGSRTRPQDLDSSVVWHQVDLLDRESTDSVVREIRASHLLHMAWYSGHSDIYQSPENNRWVPASLDLLRSFRRAGGRRFVFGGSCAEYDWSEGLCSEHETPLRPATTYGAAKVALYRAVEDYLGRVELSGAWARIFFLFGPREPEKRLIASVVTSLLRDEPAKCSNGEQERDYLYVGDVADALVTLLASDVCGAVNIASGDAPPIKDLIVAAAQKLGKENLLRLGALPTPASEAPLVQAEVGRLVGEVGWHIRHGHDRGLDETIRYWKEHLRVKA